MTVKPLLAFLLLSWAAAAQPSPAEAARQWNRTHEQAILSEYLELLRIPNIASDDANMRRNAAHIRAMLHNAMEANLHAEDFTAELWKQESPKQKETQAVLKAFGALVSLTLVDRATDGAKRIYRYRFEFAKNTLLQRFVFDEQNKLVEANTEEIL